MPFGTLVYVLLCVVAIAIATFTGVLIYLDDKEKQKKVTMADKSKPATANP